MIEQKLTNMEVEREQEEVRRERGARASKSKMKNV